MVVAEVVVGIVGWIRGFEECQGLGVSGDRTWWGAGPVDSWWGFCPGQWLGGRLGVSECAL